ncbi:MAG: ABC transporter permease [Pseudomonadota bacterium]
MSPINQRRWQNFKANKRGYYSAWIFLVLFATTLCAEFIANDKPIVMSLNDQIYFPVLITYTEVELGGEFQTEADYREAYMRNRIAQEGWAIWPPVPFAADTIDWALEPPYPSPPSSRHWLGTNGSGNDVLAILVHGIRLSVLFGLTLTLVSSTIGITVGALQGYFGGLTDLLGQRFVEIWAGLPILLILIILASMVEPNVYWLLMALAAFSWMALVGVVRAEFLRARNFEFVRAARALGVGDITIMRRHVLPNAMVAALTLLPFILNGAITTLTALDFLGFGLPLEDPSLGRLLQQAKRHLHAPWLGLIAFLSLAVILTLLIFIGEAVRDALDPRRTLIGSTGAQPNSGVSTIGN